RYLFTIHEADDVDGLGSLDLNLGDVVRLDYGVTIRLVLIAFRDLIVSNHLIALLAAFVVADWSKIVAVQLVKLNFLAGLDRVVDANGDRNQQKSYVALPD